MNGREGLVVFEDESSENHKCNKLRHSPRPSADIFASHEAAFCPELQSTPRGDRSRHFAVAAAPLCSFTGGNKGVEHVPANRWRSTWSER